MSRRWPPRASSRHARARPRRRSTRRSPRRALASTREYLADCSLDNSNHFFKHNSGRMFSQKHRASPTRRSATRRVFARVPPRAPRRPMRAAPAPARRAPRAQVEVTARAQSPGMRARAAAARYLVASPSGRSSSEFISDMGAFTPGVVTELAPSS